MVGLGVLLVGLSAVGCNKPADAPKAATPAYEDLIQGAIGLPRLFQQQVEPLLRVEAGDHRRQRGAGLGVQAELLLQRRLADGFPGRVGGRGRGGGGRGRARGPSRASAVGPAGSRRASPPCPRAMRMPFLPLPAGCNASLSPRKELPSPRW